MGCHDVLTGHVPTPQSRLQGLKDWGSAAVQGSRVSRVWAGPSMRGGPVLESPAGWVSGSPLLFGQAAGA